MHDRSAPLPAPPPIATPPNAPPANAAPANDGLPGRERLQALVAISTAVAMATLDTAITNTALPTIASDIGSDGASAVWVVNAYQLVMVATLLPLASLGEIVGHRRVYIAGMLLFTATSLACGFAWSLASLVAARALQGLGAAAIMSVNTALVRFVYPAKMLGRGVGFNALVVGVAFTLGPTVASAILSVTTWHWLFLINVPAGLIAIAFALRTLPMTPRVARRFDAIAAALSAGFFALLILGLGAVAHHSDGRLVATEWAVALLCGIALLKRESRQRAPILAVDLFRHPIFFLSAVTSVCAFAAQGLAFVSLPFLFQTVMGHSAVETGFLMTPWPAIVAVMAPIAGRLSDRYPPGILGSFGLVVMCGGMASLALLPRDPSLAQLLGRLLLCGFGFGFYQSPNLRALMHSAPPERSGGASGIVGTARLLGQSIGAALVALCLTVAGDRGPELALWVGSIFAGTGSIVSVLRLVPASGRRSS
jgi:DHA2 family multidrug resistance protein-like MFS transporter